MELIEYAYKKGYRVTSSGTAINLKGEEIGSKCNDGYIYFGIRVYGVSRKIAVHRLQAFQKYGKSLFDSGIVVRHKNSNPTDNSFDNILIGSHQDNMLDIPENIRYSRSLHATSFVRKYDKEEVKSFYAQSGNSYSKTMAHFGISSKGTLHFILNGRVKH